MNKKIDQFFKISERGSTVKTEIIAGLTTFFAMAYIVVTNPNQVVGFTFGGAFDSIQTPHTMEADAVYRQVKKNIAALAAGGNYLFAGVHNTAAATQRSHIDAVLQAYRDMRGMYG